MNLIIITLNKNYFRILIAINYKEWILAKDSMKYMKC